MEICGFTEISLWCLVEESWGTQYVGWEEGPWLPCINHNSQHCNLVGKGYLCRKKKHLKNPLKVSKNPTKKRTTSRELSLEGWEVLECSIWMLSRNYLTQEDDRIPNGEKERTRIPMKAKSWLITGEGNLIPSWSPSQNTGGNAFPGLSKDSYLINSPLIYSSGRQTTCFMTPTLCCHFWGFEGACTKHLHF